MGLLVRDDARLFRHCFREMCKLIGQSVAYQYIVKKEVTIHSEDNSDFSMPIRLDVIFDENPTIDTLNRLGWISENSEEKPFIINLPWNTPHLTANARITIESVDGTARPRVFKITKIKSDLEFPDAYTCALVPVYDQLTQRNQYTLLNEEKISTDESNRTSEDQPYTYLTGKKEIDNVPDEYKEWQDTYTFIDDKSSPYTG